MEALPVVGVVLGIVVALVALAGWRRERVRAREAYSAKERTAEELRRAVEISEHERRSASQILSSMQEGVLLFAEDGTTSFANPAVEGHLGSIGRAHV